MQWPLVGREAALDHGLELVESGTGVALLGPAGVGKSRLLHELADRAERSGKAVVRTVASVSSRTIPFGPFAELLPPGPTQDRLLMLQAARASLDARAGDRGLVMAVDDAHHLDESSLAFLISVVSSGVATVVLTARTGEPMPADLVDLWTNGVIERLDMTPLDRSDARLLLEARLGAVSSELEGELWSLAAGNPLVLHEVIEGAVGDSIIQDGGGEWVKAGPLAESARLSDLVASRLGELPPEVRPAMDVVAVGSPLPMAVARRALGDGLSYLEENRLVTTTDAASDRELIPAHPLYGEILESHIGEQRARAAYRRLVESCLNLDPSPDPVRVAIWQRACGEIVSPELSIAGAQAALVRHEPGLTEQLLEPLGTDDDRVALLLGRALSYRQRFEEAEDLLAGRAPSDEVLLGEMASIRAQNMGFGLGRVDDARRLLHEVAESIEDADLRARLINERAMVSAIHGDFGDSMASSDQVLSDPETSVISRAAAYVTLTVALAMTGDCDQMDEIIDDAIEVSNAARDVLPFARDQVGVMQTASALHAGRISDAIQHCSEALDDRERGNAMTTTWLSASVMVFELAGRLFDARAAATEALEIYAEADPFGLETQTKGILGLASGQMGTALSDEMFSLEHPQAGARLVVWLSRGRAWSAAARGDLESAVRIAAQGGRDAMTGEHFAWAALCFSDVARFGGADEVMDDMGQIDATKGAHLIGAIQQYVEAAAAESPASLRAVADRFASFGCWMLAADAYAQASVLSVAEGAEVEAARSVALSMAAESKCQQPLTPALSGRPALVTPRELEVALDAAVGMTSPEISDKRFISVRTVDNHLSSVYRKMGLNGREDLAVTFARMEPDLVGSAGE